MMQELAAAQGSLIREVLLHVEDDQEQVEAYKSFCKVYTGKIVQANKI